MSTNGLRPEDVFTPRAPLVNPKTYISRPDLEARLSQALRLPKHIVIHGESGTGKTWLYKKVLGDAGYYIEVANMGLCAGSKSVADVLMANISREVIVSSESTRVVGGGLPAVAKVEAAQKESKISYHDAFYSALEAVRGRAKDSPACIVFDNLEQVVQAESLVRELSGYLLLLDDERYADFEVKIVMVGTSDEIRSFISQVRTSAPVANRIIEIPEVSRLTFDQASKFAEVGFFDLLGCEVHEKEIQFKDQIISWISYYSDRIPLHIQELCFFISVAAETSDWIISRELVLGALREWIRSSLVADVTRVQKNLNSIRTSIGRRNQVLFCLGKIHTYDFNASDVESSVNKHFPESSRGRALNIPQILSDLSKSEHPLIRRNPNSAHYRFIDPKYRIVVRWILRKTEGGEEIILRDFDSALSLWAESHP